MKTFNPAPPPLALTMAPCWPRPHSYSSLIRAPEDQISPGTDTKAPVWTPASSRERLLGFWVRCRATANQKQRRRPQRWPALHRGSSSAPLTSGRCFCSWPWSSLSLTVSLSPVRPLKGVWMLRRQRSSSSPASCVGSVFCSDPNLDHVTGNRVAWVSWPPGGARSPLCSDLLLLPECVGLRFSWLHAVLHDWPSVLNFAARLRCSSGLCPRQLHDYGCSCRHVASGNPVDALDR